LTPPLILLGSGGHASVLAECIQLCGFSLYAVVSPTKPEGPLFEQSVWLNGDANALDLDVRQYRVVNGVGSIGDTGKRKALFDLYKSKGFYFQNIVHPSAVISPHLRNLGEGFQALSGCIVNTGCHIGDNVVLNSRAVVEHHCRIGNHSFVASSATLCGSCEVEDQVHIGAAAVLNQGLFVGHGALIATGSVVIRNVTAKTLVMGVPARKQRDLSC